MPNAVFSWKESIQTAVVVPCYNEERRLDVNAFGVFLRQNPGIGCCFVDDGSRDGTWQRLQEALPVWPEGQAALLRLPENRGKAEAVRAGILHLVEHCPAGYLGFWDADLATPLEEIVRFAELLDGEATLRFVCGARIPHLGTKLERQRLRHWLGRIFAISASAVLGIRIYDTQCGAKMMTRDLAQDLFCDPFTSPWFFDVELFARTRNLLGKANVPAAVHEMPLHQWTGVGGSSVGPGAFLRAPLDLLKILFRYGR